MHEYEYEVIDRDGRVAKGRMAAASVTDLVRELGSEGHTVIEVREPRFAGSAPFRRRPSRQDRILALHELTTLLESGVSLGDAVRAQASGARHPAIMAAFEAMARELFHGQSFLHALRAGRFAFPAYVYQLAEAGELNGHLAEALSQAVAQMQYDERVATQMRGALLYPSILVVCGCAAVLLVFILVIPQFSGLLESRDELPLLADIVLRAGLWFNANGWWLSAGLALAAIGVAGLARREGVRRRIRNGLSTLPILRDWFTETDTAKWASIMSAMLASRVGLLDALGLAARSVQISRRRVLLEQATSDVRDGASLSAALEKHRTLTPAGYSLLRVGEQSGQLTEMLRVLATLHDESSRRRMKRFLTLIEPLAIVVVGGFLGVIMIAIVQAITSVNDIAF